MDHPFELFMCCPGGGTVICNKAITVNNDYKQIGFIYHCGKLKWYVDPKTYVPEEDRIRIEETAARQAEEWEKWFSSLPEIDQYCFLLDNVPHKIFMEAIHMVNENSQEKILFLKKGYLDSIPGEFTSKMSKWIS